MPQSNLRSCHRKESRTRQVQANNNLITPIHPTDLRKSIHIPKALLNILDSINKDTHPMVTPNMPLKTATRAYHHISKVHPKEYTSPDPLLELKSTLKATPLLTNHKPLMMASKFNNSDHLTTNNSRKACSLGT